MSAASSSSSILFLSFVNVPREFTEDISFPGLLSVCSFLDRTDGRLMDAVMIADAADFPGMICNGESKTLTFALAWIHRSFLPTNDRPVSPWLCFLCSSTPLFSFSGIPCCWSCSPPQTIRPNMPRRGKLDHEEDVCILSVCMALLLVTSSFQAMFFKIHELTGHVLLSVKQPKRFGVRPTSHNLLGFC